jgi:chromosome segregation ATPase
MINVKGMIIIAVLVSLALVYGTNYYSNKKNQVEISKYIDIELTLKNSVDELQNKLINAQVKISELEKVNQEASKANSDSQANYNKVSENLQKANSQITDLEGQLKRKSEEDEKIKNELKEKVQGAEKTIDDLKRVLSAHNITAQV